VEKDLDKVYTKILTIKNLTPSPSPQERGEF
jgi:hypothetical protein